MASFEAGLRQRVPTTERSGRVSGSSSPTCLCPCHHDEPRAGSQTHAGLSPAAIHQSRAADPQRGTPRPDRLSTGRERTQFAPRRVTEDPLQRGRVMHMLACARTGRVLRRGAGPLYDGPGDLEDVRPRPGDERASGRSRSPVRDSARSGTAGTTRRPVVVRHGGTGLGRSPEPERGSRPRTLGRESLPTAHIELRRGEDVTLSSTRSEADRTTFRPTGNAANPTR